ncbi:piggyBac transposable element-derived protein 4 [Caerostris darwini]|uniref:PiggyBac transposable element-derived protein 4 n=1 Tax=Caerostris darwini TaxID=1538125 RepID=A0AAV4TDB3_9ARAC|nr:piggyBac transposable element-derived protein 4 [Caerostris darwini]
MSYSRLLFFAGISRQTCFMSDGHIRHTKPQEKRSPKGNAEKKKIEKGEIIAFQRGKVTVMKLMDKKKVSLLSTIHNTEMEQIQVRSEMKEKPKIVMDYNTMGGVETAWTKI